MRYNCLDLIYLQTYRPPSSTLQTWTPPDYCQPRYELQPWVGRLSWVLNSSRRIAVASWHCSIPGSSETHLSAYFEWRKILWGNRYQAKRAIAALKWWNSDWGRQPQVEFPVLALEFELRALATMDCCRFYYAMLDTIDTCFRTGAPVKEFAITFSPPIISFSMPIIYSLINLISGLMEIKLYGFIFN